MWLRNLLGGLFSVKIEPTVIMCDNHSFIKLSENLIFHDKSKHIEMKYRFIRYMVQKGIVKLQYIAIDGQIADLMTKPLFVTNFRHSRDMLGMAQNVSLIERDC